MKGLKGDHHYRAAEVALKHLVDLGHRKIAFIKGQAFVPDTDVRWNSILGAAAQMELPIAESLVTQISDNSPTPQPGFVLTRKLLASGDKFTALFAFNDISAMGAIRALREAKLRVPDDVSVVGFDDIQSAAYLSPPLTTVRQPLQEMGEIAARTLLDRIEKRVNYVPEISIAPEFVVRDSTAPPNHRRAMVSSAESDPAQNGRDLFQPATG